MSRILRIVLIGLVVVAVSVGAAFALADSGAPKPGKGCGDKNTVHYRQDECKPPLPG